MMHDREDEAQCLNTDDDQRNRMQYSKGRHPRRELTGC